MQQILMQNQLTVDKQNDLSKKHKKVQYSEKVVGKSQTQHHRLEHK